MGPLRPYSLRIADGICWTWAILHLYLFISTIFIFFLPFLQFLFLIWAGWSSVDVLQQHSALYVLTIKVQKRKQRELFLQRCKANRIRITELNRNRKLSYHFNANTHRKCISKSNTDFMPSDFHFVSFTEYIQWALNIEHRQRNKTKTMRLRCVVISVMCSTTSFSFRSFLRNLKTIFRKTHGDCNTAING